MRSFDSDDRTTLKEAPSHRPIGLISKSSGEESGTYVAICMDVGTVGSMRAGSIKVLASALQPNAKIDEVHLLVSPE